MVVAPRCEGGGEKFMFLIVIYRCLNHCLTAHTDTQTHTHTHTHTHRDRPKNLVAVTVYSIQIVKSKVAANGRLKK